MFALANRRRRKPFHLVRGLAFNRPQPRKVFIGRDRELGEFRRLSAGVAGSWAAAERRSSLLLVGGDPGVGKRELLAQFRAVCLMERKPARCGPLVDLSEPRQIEDVLREIVSDLVRTHPSAFQRFEKALRNYEDVVAGRKTPAEQALAASREAAGIVPLLPPAKKALESQLADRAADAVAGPGDAEAVREAFVRDVTALADADVSSRLVLLCADLDARQADRDVIWLRTWLFPLLARPSILLVASTSQVDLDDRGALGGLAQLEPEVLVLRPFDPEASRRYATEVLGLWRPRQIEEVVKRSEGVLERLEGLRLYFERHPEARERDALPDEALAWASGGTVYDLLQQVKSDYLRELIVAASPLRWFNAALLEEIADAAELERGDEDVTPADLVRRSGGERPLWITNVGAGWSIEGDARRRAFADELRRLNPGLHMRIHLVAARYHHGRLVAWNAEPEAAGPAGPRAADTDVFSDPTAGGIAHLLDDHDATQTLAEWLYHLLALARDRAFPMVVEKSLEAMFEEAFETPHDVAATLLAIGPEIRVTRRQRLYLDLLARASASLAQGQYADAVQSLDQLFLAGEPTPLAKPVLAHLRAYAHWRLNQVSEAVEWFERADGLFARDDDYGMRIRCVNAAYWALGVATRDGVEKAALEILHGAVQAAEKRDELDLLAELHRARALVLEEVGNLVGAEQAYGGALEAFERAGMLDQVALVRQNRSNVLISRGRFGEAEEELDAAAAIYRYLADVESEANVWVGKMRISLAQANAERAEQQRAEALRLQGSQADLRNAIGLAFFSAGDFGRAVDEFAEAVKLAPESAVFHSNLADALARSGRWEEAFQHFDEALERVRDEWAALRLAETRRLTGDRPGAKALFGELKEERLRDIRRRPDSASAHSALGSLLQRWAADESGDERTALLREAEEAFRKAADLEPDEPVFRLRLGEALLALGDAGSARTELWRAAEASPGNENVRAALIRAVAELPVDDAIAALEMFPNDRELGAVVAEKAAGLDDDDVARVLKLAVDRSPEDPELHFLLGTKLLTLVRRHADGEHFQADAREPGAVAAGAETGAAASEDPVTSARAELRQARRLAAERDVATADRVRYLLELADFLTERGDWDEAKAAVDEAMELEPDNPRALDITTRIDFRNSWVRLLDDPYPAQRPVVVEVADDLLPWVEPPAAADLYSLMFPEMKRILTEQTGMSFPGVLVRWNAVLEPGYAAVSIHGVLLHAFRAGPELLAGAPADECAAAGVEATAAKLPWDGRPGAWVRPADVEPLEERDIPVWDPRGVLVTTVGRILREHAASLFDTQQVVELLRQSGLGAATSPTFAARLAAVGRRRLAESGRIDDFTTLVDDVASDRGVPTMAGEPA